MILPNHLLYTKEHEWIEFKDDLAIVGLQIMLRVS